MVLFKDMNKAANDLLNKDYCTSQSFEIEHKFKSINPLFTATALVGPNSTSKTATIKYTNPYSFDEIKFNSNGFSSLESNLNIPQVKNLKVGLTIDSKITTNAKESVVFNSEYFNDNFHGKLVFKPFNPQFNLSVMKTMKSPFNGSISLGSSLNGILDKMILQYTLGASYDSHTNLFQYSVSALTANADSLSLGNYMIYAYGKTKSKQASEYAVIYSKNKSDANAQITFGGQWLVGEGNETKVKAKIGLDMKSSVAVTQKLSEFLTATVGAQIDLTKQNGDSVKYGIKLNTSA